MHKKSERIPRSELVYLCRFVPDHQGIFQVGNRTYGENWIFWDVEDFDQQRASVVAMEGIKFGNEMYRTKGEYPVFIESGCNELGSIQTTVVYFAKPSS